MNGVVFTGNPLYPQTTSFNKDKNNWGPRVGITYDLGGLHRTVVRAGWGIYYGRTSNSAISSSLTNNAVTFATYSLTPTSLGAPQYPNSFSAPPTGSGSVPQIQYLAPGLERPRDRDGRSHPRAPARLGNDGVGLLPLQQGQPPADVRRREPAAANRDRGPRRGRHEPRHLPVLPRGASRQPGDEHDQGRRQRRIDLSRARVAGESPLLEGPAVQRELHAVEVRGHGPELDDVHLELLDAGQPVRRRGRIGSDELRPEAPLRDELPLRARLPVGHPGGRDGHVRERSAAQPDDFDQRRRDERHRRDEHGIGQRQRRLEPRAVRYPQRLPPDRPQDVRHSAVEGL